MTLAKLSLAAIVALGTSAFAADTLAEAFQNGKVKGEIKAYYFTKDGGTTDADIFTTGLRLNYETASFYGFKAGATMQSSSSPFADEDGKDVFKPDMHGSGANLSEAYLAYTTNKTTLKIGRQFSMMPLLKESGTRVVRGSFEGASITSYILPDTTLFAAYIDKYSFRTDGNGKIAEFVDVEEGEEGINLSVINKSIKGLTLTASYLEIGTNTFSPADGYELLYTEAVYKNKVDDLSYYTAAQYSNTSWDAGSDSYHYGVKVGAGMNGFNAFVAYAAVDDEANSAFGLGATSGAQIYTTTFTNGGIYHADTSGYAIDVNYKVKGTVLGARYTDVENDNFDKDDERTALYANYAFGGQLKGLNLNVIYEMLDGYDAKNAGADKELDTLWVRASYKF